VSSAKGMKGSIEEEFGRLNHVLVKEKAAVQGLILGEPHV